MSKENFAERAAKLRELINDYRYNYHVLNKSIMSEAAADSLKHELTQIETEHPELITSDSPTQRVAGEPLPQFRKIRHSSRMLSLNDVFDEAEFYAWINRIKKLLASKNSDVAESSARRSRAAEEAAGRTTASEQRSEATPQSASKAQVGELDSADEPDTLEFFMDVKMDGLACALVYQDGVLVQGITRGDGFVGEDVTANIRTIESIPLRLRNSLATYEQKDSKTVGLEAGQGAGEQRTGFFRGRSSNRGKNVSVDFLKGRTEIRGEIVMYKEQFEKLNAEREKQGLPKFANPRNLAAGTIRQLDPKLVAGRPLEFHAYDLLRDDPTDVPTNDYAYKTIRELGLKANQVAAVAKNPKDVMKFAAGWEEKRKELPFNTDGLVVKVNDRAQVARLGVVGKAPRGAVAYKYPAEQATTKVKDIFVSIGRTGKATPVAMLEPVVVAGSTVQMATLHNESEVARKDIRVGDTVIIHKAGDVIPEIVEPLVSLRNGSEKKFKMPDVCSDCGTKLVRVKAADVDWRCPNDSCPSRSWKIIEHYASKAALDIDGLGEKNVIALIDAGLIKDAADIYKVKKEDLLKLERFAEISATKLVKAIADKKNPELPRFLYGLGIRHIGTQTAIDLAAHFRSLEKLSRATIDELSEVEGIGEVVAEAVVEWFEEPRNQKLLAKFKACGVEPKSAEQTSGPLTGKNFVVTGSLDSMSRDEAAEKIRSLGGTFQSSVGKETDFLVVGANVGASKLAKADKLGTKQIDETEFLKLINNK